MGYSDLVKKIAHAIATAEGFFIAGSVPQRNNNPGDIKADLIGKAVGFDSRGFAIFATPEDGWNNLYAQVQGMVSGSSRIYSPSMTIAQVADHYAEGDPNWSANVAAALGVTPDTPLNQVV